MGEADSPPDDFLPLIARRVLWQEYGISLPMEFDDAYMAILLHSAETAHQNAQDKRTPK